jgi:hypothetical protein
VPEPLLHYVVNPGGVSMTRRKEQIQTKNRLLQEIGINRADLIEAVSNYREILSKYEAFDYSGLRSILLAREIKLALNANSENVQLKKTAVHVDLSFRNAKQVTEFVIKTYIRKLIRIKARAPRLN